MPHYLYYFLPIILFATLSCSEKRPIVEIETTHGTIKMVLYSDKAPITVANFLKYVEENRLVEGKAHFYRVVRMDNQPDNKIKIEVIQGGLGMDGDHPLELPAIEHETTAQTGILHKDGIVSMARLEPGTAGSEIFICVGEQPSLDFGGQRNPDGQGFAAFGKVLAGMEVVRKIQQLADEGQMLKETVPFTAVRRIK